MGESSRAHFHFQTKLQWYVLITSLSIACSFIACGSWCIYAARKIKEEESVYHFEGEFMPDDENPSKSRKSKKASSQEASARSNAGSDTSGIEIGEQHGQEKEQERHKGYFKTVRVSTRKTVKVKTFSLQDH